MRGRKFFEKILLTQDRFRNPDAAFTNSVQTNGTLVDRFWALFFRRHNFSVGVSLDGPPNIHNVQRAMAGGRGNSFEAVMRGVQLLRENDVPFGVLIVVTRETVKLGADRMFEFLLDNKITDYAFLQERPNVLGVPDAAAAIRVTTREMSRYLQRMFDIWFEHDDPTIHVREFDSIIETLLGGSGSVCTLGGDCCGNYLGVMPNGDVYHCDEFVPGRDYLLGNILQNAIGEILGAASLKTLKMRNHRRVLKCRQCPWYSSCRGGCPYVAYVRGTSNSREASVCCGDPSLIEHIYQRLQSALEAILQPSPLVNCA